MKSIAPIDKKPKPLLVTPDELVAFGTALFGTEWRVPLAKALHVDRKTLYRWEREICPIPGPVLAVMELIEKKHPLQKRKRTA